MRASRAEKLVQRFSTRLCTCNNCSWARAALKETNAKEKLIESIAKEPKTCKSCIKNGAIFVLIKMSTKASQDS